MACRIELATGKLAEARHYVDAVTAMPYFREQRYIGLGRRFEVDAIAGDFDVVVANVEARCRRRPRSMGRDHPRPAPVTRALRAPRQPLDGPLDAFLALHLGEPHVANDCSGTHPSLAFPPPTRTRTTGLPWSTVAWAEAAVLTAQPDAARRLRHAAQLTYGNGIVAAIVERAKALHDRRRERLGTIARRFSAAGCSYQARRAATLATLAQDG